MAYTPTSSRGTLTTSAGATVATVTSGKSWLIKQLILVNESSSPVTVNLSFAAVKVLTSKVLAANETFVMDLTQNLTSGQTITGDATTGSVARWHLGYVEYP